MRMGLMVGTRGNVDEVIAEVRGLVDAGLQTAWLAQVSTWDALTLLSVIGREVPDVELGTAVIPTYPRHPIMLAVQALTTQAIVGPRLALGIGLSHPVVIEGSFGYSYEKPARHMREYLSVLLPLLREGKVDFTGETLKAQAQVSTPGAAGADMPVLLAALAPQMLKLAGAVAEGTITWMTGPATIESHIVPSITKAATDAGRPSPRVVCGLPIAVTDDAESGRERAQRGFQFYGFLPSYRAMLDKEGAAQPGDVAIVGDEKAVGAVLDRLADAGTTDFLGAMVASSADRQRTIDFLASRA